MLRKFFLFVLVVLLVLPWQPSIAQAQNFATTIPTLTQEGITYPDWERLSFSAFPTVLEAGRFDLSQVADSLGINLDDLVDEIGYDPSRFWEVGTNIEEILKLGDFQGISTLGNWNLQTVTQYVDLDFDSLNLGDFGLLQGETLQDIVYAIPNLRNLDLDEVRPFFDAVQNSLGFDEAFDLRNTPLKDVVDWDVAGSLTLDGLDLSQYGLGEIPELLNAPFGKFMGWGEKAIAQIPGLSYVPLPKFVFGLLGGNFLGKIDIVFGEKEANRVNTITGSYEAGFNIPCQQPNCAHLELADVTNLPTPVLKGKQWISGKSQEVEGGSGILKWVNDGKEPTGRHPFGDLFKVVLTDTVESTGTAGFSIYFRFCVNSWFAQGCTPYFIGPFPWFSQQEKDLIFVGVDGVAAEIPDGLPQIPTNPGLPPEYANDPRFGVDYGGGGSSARIGDDDCNTYKGVQMGALKQAIANIESYGGDYYAVGVWTRVPREGNQGRALGKYQYMSYREDVEAVFGRKAGGRELLAQIRDNRISESEIKARLPEYFPPEVQEELRQEDFRKLINRAYAQGARDSQLVYKLGGWHYAGTGSFNDGYARRAEAEYQNELPGMQQKCSEKGQCTGRLITPAKGVFTSGYGWRWGRMHKGIDIAAPIGTPIIAADGGKVIFAGWNSGGYGNLVRIQHDCSGIVTLYAHQNRIRVKRGQPVNQGDLVGDMGSTGFSTGSHLHFETIVKGSHQDPKLLLPSLD